MPMIRTLLCIVLLLTAAPRPADAALPASPVIGEMAVLGAVVANLRACGYDPLQGVADGLMAQAAASGFTREQLEGLADVFVGGAVDAPVVPEFCGHMKEILGAYQAFALKAGWNPDPVDWLRGFLPRLAAFVSDSIRCGFAAEAVGGVAAVSGLEGIAGNGAERTVVETASRLKDHLTSVYERAYRMQAPGCAAVLSETAQRALDGVGGALFGR